MVIWWKFVDYKHTFTFTFTSTSVRENDKNMKIEFFYLAKATHLHSSCLLCASTCFAILSFTNLFAYDVSEFLHSEICLNFATKPSQNAIKWRRNNWWEIMLLLCNNAMLSSCWKWKSVLSNDFCELKHQGWRRNNIWSYLKRWKSGNKTASFSHIRAIGATTGDNETGFHMKCVFECVVEWEH